MKSFAATLLMTIALLSIPHHLVACVRELEKRTTVRDHFDVLVQSGGQPVVGMEVGVEYWDESANKWARVATATTEQTGLARFVGVPAGEYFVSTHSPVENDGHPIEVSSDPKKSAEERIALVWPPRKVFVASKFEGVLTSIGDTDLPSEELAGVTIKILEAHSGNVAAVASTDAEGKFTLDIVPPGLYFLELSGENRVSDDIRIWGQKLEGYMAVEYNPLKRDAPASLQVRLMMTDCGLMYKVAK